MSFSSIESMIRLEQERQQGSFIESENLDAYILKLKSNAELVTHYVAGELAGFVAFYCNDESKNMSFITLVLLSPEHRGLGLASCMIDYTLKYSKRKGFKRCALEVNMDNAPAIKLYQKYGFSIKSEISEKYFMTINT